MVLISTWLEWSGITFRNVDAKLGTQQRFHQQKESIQEDSRWVLLFKDFGWVCLVTTQFQVSDLEAASVSNAIKALFSVYQQTQSHYTDVTTTGWRSAITWWYSRAWPPLFRTISQNNVNSQPTNPFYAPPEALQCVIPPDVNWRTDNPRHPTARYRNHQRTSVLVLMCLFYFL